MFDYRKCVKLMTYRVIHSVIGFLMDEIIVKINDSPFAPGTL